MEKNPGPVTNGTTSWSDKLKIGKLKNSFRVTAWFKRGEIEELVRTAAAKSEAVDPFAGPVATDAVVEDSAITRGDHDRLSLNTGATPSTESAMPGELPAALTADRMSDKQMLAELTRSRLYVIIGGASVGIAAVVATAYYFLSR